MPRLVARLIDDATFASLLPHFDDRDYQVSAPYVAAISRLRGERLEYVAIDDGPAVTAIAIVRLRRVPTLGSVGLVAGGPLIAAGSAEQWLREHRAAMAALTEEYTARGVRLHIRPPVMPSIVGWMEDGHALSPGVLPSPLFARYHTMVLDLEATEDERRAGLSEGWRRHLRESERSTLEHTHASVGDTWARMRPMYEEMLQRKQFSADLPPEFWTDVFAADDADTHFRGVLVHSRGRNLAGAILGGDANVATFLLGATTHAALPLRAGYLAMWAAIGLAKRTGHRFLDLGGVDRQRNPGGWQFKHGLRGREIITPQPVVASPPNLRGAALAWSERAASALRSRRSH